MDMWTASAVIAWVEEHLSARLAPMVAVLIAVTVLRRGATSRIEPLIGKEEDNVIEFKRPQKD